MRDVSGKKWYVVEACIARSVEEAARSLLFDLGAGGILTIREDVDDIVLGAYFELEHAAAGRIPILFETELERAGLATGLIRLCCSEVPEEDWMQKWKDGFEQFEVGTRLTIRPSWQTASGSDERRNARTVIKMDPGMAFGTGGHETTRLALEIIERHWRGGTFLDVGTGTGILAIAAALLAPASTVAAIDVDPVAVAVARENAESNGVSAQVEVVEGTAADFAGRGFDMLAANLTAESIIAELPSLVRCISPSASMILSGILTELSEDVVVACRASGLVPVERAEAAEWTAFLMRLPQG